MKIPTQDTRCEQPENGSFTSAVSWTTKGRFWRIYGSIICDQTINGGIMVGHYWTIFGKDHGLRSGFVFVFLKKDVRKNFRNPMRPPWLNA